MNKKNRKICREKVERDRKKTRREGVVSDSIANLWFFFWLVGLISLILFRHKRKQNSILSKWFWFLIHFEKCK